MAQGDQIVGVPDHDGGIPPQLTSMDAGELIADPGGLFHPVQGDVKQQWAGDPALRSSLLGGDEPTLFDHARLQPLSDLFPGGERAELGEKPVMVDSVERRCQVRVKHPPAARVRTPHHLVDGLDRVVTAATRAKSIGSRLEPRFPLGLQRVDRLRLAHAVDNHRNAERALFPVRLRDVHPLDGLGNQRCAAVAHRVDQSGLARSGHHNDPIDACRLAASVALGHPPHAHKSVGARPEHQLLQTADPLEVPCLRCRKDTLTQTPYFVLDSGPVHQPPVEIVVLRSVRRHGSAAVAPNLPFSSGVFDHRRPHRLT